VQKQRISRWYLLLVIVVLLLYLPLESVSAAEELEDGKYTIDYDMLKGENDSVSISNDYWLKPATLIVSNGKMTLQHDLKNSDWVVSYQIDSNGSLSDTKVISTDKEANKRKVEFPVSTIDNPTSMKIHVIVTSIDYDHKYTVRMSYKPSTLKLVEAAKPVEVEVPTTENNSKPNHSKPAEFATENTVKQPANTSNETKQPSQPKASDKEKTTEQVTKETTKSAVEVAATTGVKETLDATKATEMKEQSAEVPTTNIAGTTKPEKPAEILVEQEATNEEIENSMGSSIEELVVEENEEISPTDESQDSELSESDESKVVQELEVKEVKKDNNMVLWILLGAIALAVIAGGAFRYYKVKK